MADWLLKDVTLVLFIFATFYLAFKLVELNGVVSHFGRARLTTTWSVMVWGCVTVQAIFAIVWFGK